MFGDAMAKDVYLMHAHSDRVAKGCTISEAFQKFWKPLGIFVTFSLKFSTPLQPYTLINNIAAMDRDGVNPPRGRENSSKRHTL